MTELLAHRVVLSLLLGPHMSAPIASLCLDPGLEGMPRTLERAKTDAPESLRKRNLYALPDFLDVR